MIPADFERLRWALMLCGRTELVYPTAYRGLGLYRSYRALPAGPLCLPFGWTARRDLDRHAVIMAPRWVHWLARLAAWREYVFPALVSLGFWDLPAEGCFYHEGRWNWAWWRGQDRAMGHVVERHFMPASVMIAMHRRNWFQRLGWWIERRLIADWHARMPEWAPDAPQRTFERL